MVPPPPTEEAGASVPAEEDVEHAAVAVSVAARAVPRVIRTARRMAWRVGAVRMMLGLLDRLTGPGTGPVPVELVASYMKTVFNIKKI
jgi:hypothetical protein